MFQTLKIFLADGLELMRGRFSSGQSWQEIVDEFSSFRYNKASSLPLGQEFSSRRSPICGSRRYVPDVFCPKQTAGVLVLCCLAAWDYWKTGDAETAVSLGITAVILAVAIYVLLRSYFKKT